ncbi:MAG: hypothetical protein ACPGXL_09425, partial [Chitinophagales bacterium]
VQFLRLLAALPPPYKKDEYRILLLQAILKECHRHLSTSDSKKILENIEGLKNDTYGATQKTNVTSGIIDYDFRSLALLSRRFLTTQSILDHVNALKPLEKELLIEELSPTIAKDKIVVEEKSFLEQLLDNPQTFYVAALVKRLWSGLNIPIHHQMPSDQALGGISDITNKGQLDKLLFSEFANEDVLFLSRLANNEALFFRREVPPFDNPRQRILLVDLSLKNWGTIKHIAYACLLAINEHPKSTKACEAYGFGKEYHPIMFYTPEQVVEYLQLVESCLHGATGLEKFFKENKIRDKEIFLIAGKDALAHPDMQKVLSDYGTHISYWLHPSTSGELSLFKRQSHSKKLVQKLQLPLEQLWANPPKKKKKTRPIRWEGESVWLNDYPILFANPQRIQAAFKHKNNYYKVSKTRSLFVSFGQDVRSKGWQLLYHKLPVSVDKMAMGKNDSGELVLLMASRQRKAILLLNLTTKALISSPFEQWENSRFNHFLFWNGAFYYMEDNGINFWKINLKGQISRGKFTQNNQILIDLHTTKQKEQNGLSSSMGYPVAVFKNVKRVFINQKNNLVFNQHELYLNVGNVVKMDISRTLAIGHQATQVNTSTFEFEDGSLITIHPAGMLILLSSNPDIPKIFVPSLLDRALGVATEDHFAGYTYFQKKQAQYQACRVRLMSYNPTNKKKIITLIQKVLNTFLVIERTPILLSHNLPSIKALQLKEGLKLLGAEVTLEGLDQSSPTMTTQSFFNDYITPFIEHIKLNSSGNF